MNQFKEQHTIHRHKLKNVRTHVSLCIIVSYARKMNGIAHFSPLLLLLLCRNSLVAPFCLSASPECGMTEENILLVLFPICFDRQEVHIKTGDGHVALDGGGGENRVH